MSVMSANAAASACLTSLAAGVLTMNAAASVDVFAAYGDWSAAAGGLDEQIDFVFAAGQPLQDQYASLGVHFAYGNSYADFLIGTNDGWGLITLFDANATVPITFDVPQHAFALDFISPTQLTFYLGDVLVYQSITFFNGPPNKFRGYVLSDAFDKVIMSKGSFGTGGDYSADNLYIGTPIPGPGALALAALAGVLARTRRRR